MTVSTNTDAFDASLFFYSPSVGSFSLFRPRRRFHRLLLLLLFLLHHLSFTASLYPIDSSNSDGSFMLIFTGVNDNE